MSEDISATPNEDPAIYEYFRASIRGILLSGTFLSLFIGAIWMGFDGSGETTRDATIACSHFLFSIVLFMIDWRWFGNKK